MNATRPLLSFSTLAAAGTAALLLLPSAIPQSGPSPFSVPSFRPNLLRNGGLEIWSFGIDGTRPPTWWFPMGDAANTFNNQDALLIHRVPGDSDCPSDVGGGEWAMELTALEPGNFISQRLENATEFRCKTVTLIAHFMTPYNVTSPEITIDDGVSSSSDTRQLVIGEWIRFSVTHKVSEHATKLEIKIDPDTISIVDDVQLVCGDFPNTPYVPNGAVDAALLAAPLGSVVPWYPMAPGISVPEGFAIADGSTVTDPESHFFGLATVDLSGRFVLGTTDPNTIGTSGGVLQHDLSHDHDIYHRHTGTTGLPDDILPNIWIVPPPNGGIGRAGEDGHRHNFTTSEPVDEPSGNNRSGSALGIIDNRPPFVRLLMIMRIK